MTRDVGVNGGEIARQCFDAGLLDEVHVDLVPVFLGSGIPLLGMIKGRPRGTRRPHLGHTGQRRHTPGLPGGANVAARVGLGRVAAIKRMTIQRLENVGIVVDDLAAATTYFVELGLKVLGEGPVEGDWVDRVVGLEGVRVDVAMLETSDGHGRLELMKFHTPPARGGDGTRRRTP